MNNSIVSRTLFFIWDDWLCGLSTFNQGLLISHKARSDLALSSGFPHLLSRDSQFVLELFYPFLPCDCDLRFGLRQIRIRVINDLVGFNVPLVQVIHQYNVSTILFYNPCHLAESFDRVFAFDSNLCVSKYFHAICFVLVIQAYLSSSLLITLSWIINSSFQFYGDSLQYNGTESPAVFLTSCSYCDTYLIE
jgi:hypothetical protein